MTLLQTLGIVAVQIAAGVVHTTLWECTGKKGMLAFLVTSATCTIGAGVFAAGMV